MSVLKRYTGTAWEVVGATLSGIATKTGGQASTISRNSATFVDLDTATDLTFPAAVGDLIVVENAIYTGSEGSRVVLDVGSWVSGTSTFTHWGTTVDGSWASHSASFEITPFRAQRVVVASDLVAGNLTMRWRYKTTAAKTFGHWSTTLVQNFGPAGLATGEWTAWTPALTAATTNPTLGAGAITAGRYVRNGKNVTGWGHIKFGTSGAAAGSGLYTISLPVPPKTSSTSTISVGTGQLVDAGTTSTTMVMQLWTNETVAHMQAVTNSSQVSNTIPWTWANNDEFIFRFDYEAA